MGIHFQHARVLRFLFEVVHWVSGCEKEATTPLVFRSSLFQFLSVKKRPFSVRYPKQLIGVSLRPTNEKNSVFNGDHSSNCVGRYTEDVILTSWYQTFNG